MIHSNGNRNHVIPEMKWWLYLATNRMLMLAGDHYMCKSDVILDFALFVSFTSNNNAAFAFSLGKLFGDC